MKIGLAPMTLTSKKYLKITTTPLLTNLLSLLHSIGVLEEIGVAKGKERERH